MFVTYILSKIRAYKLYRQTLNELSELSDRELADLGIARFDIAAVARKAAFAYAATRLRIKHSPARSRAFAV